MFWDLFYSLPREVQERARSAYELFERDPQHPSVNFKRVRGTRLPVYSARIDMNHRAVGVLEGNLVTWFWIGTHSEYDALLKAL